MATSCSSDWRSSRPGSLMTCGAGPNSYTSSAFIEPTRWAAQPASDVAVQKAWLLDGLQCGRHAQVRLPLGHGQGQL